MAFFRVFPCDVFCFFFFFLLVPWVGLFRLRFIRLVFPFWLQFLCVSFYWCLNNKMVVKLNITTENITRTRKEHTFALCLGFGLQPVLKEGKKMNKGTCESEMR